MLSLPRSQPSQPLAALSHFICRGQRIHADNLVKLVHFSQVFLRTAGRSLPHFRSALLARPRLRPARRLRQFDRDGCRTAGFSRLRILERQDQREVNGGATDIVTEGIARIKLPELIDLVLNQKITPGKVFDLTLSLDQVAEGYRAMDERRAIKTLLRP